MANLFRLLNRHQAKNMVMKVRNSLPMQARVAAIAKATQTEMCLGRSGNSWISCVVHCLLCSVCISSSLVAQTDNGWVGNALSEGVSIVRIYNPKKGETAGLMVEMWTPANQGIGYSALPIRVSRADGSPFPADGDFQITLSPSYQNTSERNSIHIPIRQGEREAIATLPYLSWDSYVYAYDARCELNGGRLDGLSASRISSSIYRYDESGTTLFVVENQVDWLTDYLGRQRSDASRLSQELRSGEGVPVVQEVDGFFKLGSTGYETQYALSREDLPESWLLLSSFSVVVVPATSLADLRPNQQAALRIYAQSGGTLVLTKYQSDNEATNEAIVETFWSNRSGADETLGMAESFRAAKTSFWERSWIRQQPDFGIPIRPGSLSVRQPFNVSQWNPSLYDGSDAPMMPWRDVVSDAAVTYLDLQSSPWLRLARSQKWITSDEEFVDQFRPVAFEPDFRIYDYGFGSLTTVSAFDLRQAARLRFPLETQLQVSSWYATRGVTEYNDLDAGDNYWDLLIDDVGKPPVQIFGALIGFFALGICPAILWGATRMQRQSWLLGIMPVLGIFISVGLLLFAVLADGFGAVSRERSISYLDNRNGNGFCWSRQTLFCGSPPSGGIQVRPDTELNPMNTEGALPRLRVTHGKDSTQFDSLLRAREQQQFLIRYPFRSNSLFSVTASDGTPTFRNESETEIVMGILSDGDQTFWSVADVDSNASVPLIELEDFEVQQTHGKLVQLDPLKFPVGLDATSNTSLLSWFSNSSYGSSAESPLSERALISWLTDIKNSKTAEKRFILVVDETGWNQSILPSAKVSKSFNVVVGRW